MGVSSVSRMVVGVELEPATEAAAARQLMDWSWRRAQGVKVYQTALRCAVNDELKEEWTQYLEETRNHEPRRSRGPRR
jgi:hypothetical protein